jgi:hypothetical protein
MAREPAGTDRRVLSDLWFPLFDEFADPSAIVLLSAEAEKAGWHGVFVWDHLRWRAPVRQVADPWITLAGIASATEQVRISPMVTLSRGGGPPGRQGDGNVRPTQSGAPHSRGRPWGRQLWRRIVQDMRRARRSGTGRSTRRILGDPYRRLDGRGRQAPGGALRRRRPPIPSPTGPGSPDTGVGRGVPWEVKPLHRAAHYDGFFPVNMQGLEQFEAAVRTVTQMRDDTTEPFDIVDALPPGTDVAPYASVGATWWLTELKPGVSLDVCAAYSATGPFAPMPSRQKFGDPMPADLVSVPIGPALRPHRLPSGQGRNAHGHLHHDTGHYREDRRPEQ